MIRLKPKRVPLKIVEKDTQWGNGLEAFRKRHGLSHRDLSAACSMAGEFISKSSIERLCNGKSEIRFSERVRPAILRSLRVYLEDLKLKPAEIDIELRTIFCQQEVEQVLTQRAALPKEAQMFFGLKRDPFDPDQPRTAKEVFTPPALEKVARQVEDAIHYQHFLAVIGDIGSGKTLLKKRTVETVKNSNGRLRLFWPKFFNMDKIHSGSIVYYLLHEFGQKAPQDLISRGQALENVLARLSEEGVRVALGFDECHRLDQRLIVALKNFWELGTGGFDRYLGIVLFGQPSFEFMLSQHREIIERVNIIRMPGLGKQATGYLEHRLTLAGGRLEKLFEPAAVSRMAKLADTPLALGNVANAALLKAFELNERKVVAAFVPEKNGDPRLRSMRQN